MCYRAVDLEKLNNLNRNKMHDQEESLVKLKNQLVDSEAKCQQQVREFSSFKEQLNTKPEVRLQSEINLLTLEKVILIFLSKMSSVDFVILKGQFYFTC